MSLQPSPLLPNVPERHRFVLLTLLIVLVWNFASSLVGWGWLTAATITFVVTASYVIYAWRYKDLFMANILLFSLAAGWTELLADHWLVDVTGTLVYTPGGPFVWRSPLYMPFAWMVVTTQLSYIGWWLSKRFGIIPASVLIALIGALNIPLYEQWAKGANWWFYRNTPMLGSTPWYIIGGEFLIALSLPTAMSVVEKGCMRMSIVVGLLQGLWIWGAYGLVFRLLS